MISPYPKMKLKNTKLYEFKAELSYVLYDMDVPLGTRPALTNRFIGKEDAFYECKDV